MNKNTPVIGFDRYVELAWSQAALEVSLGKMEMETLQEMVAATLSGKESQRKAMDILKRLWLKPFSGLSDFVERGKDIYKSTDSSNILPLSWGNSIVAYSFFGKTAEITGRLIMLQGDCSIKEIQRRMAEQYGERNGIERSVSRVLQSQSAWKVLGRDEENKRVIKMPAVAINDEKLIAWLVEAAARYIGKPIPLASLQSLPVLYPFTLTGSLSLAVSNSEGLELRTEGVNNQFVALREII